MPTRQKVATVKDLTDRLGRAQLTIIADYRGLSVGALQGLRGDLRPTGAEFHIAKNTLTTIAAGVRPESKVSTGYWWGQPPSSWPTMTQFKPRK